MAGYYHLDIALTLESPFLLSGLGASAYGIDAAPLRDGDGPEAPLLMPAPQVRGVLRHALEVDYKDDAERLFGKGGMMHQDEDVVGRLTFADLCADAPERADITRVAIDPETGAGKDGHLFTIELPAAVGEQVTFKGQIRLFAENDAKAKADAAILKEALDYIVAIGKFKTAGYGRLVGKSPGEPVFWRAAKAKPSNRVQGAGDAAAFDLVFSIDRPMLVDTDYPEANFMRSATAIPGTVLKGALARQLIHAGDKPDKGALADVLSKLEIGFASTERVKDLQQTVRMRVAIDGETGAAATGNLFCQSMVKPDIDGQPVVCRSRIRWPGGGDAAALDPLRILLGTLEAGLVSIGKTGAAMIDGAQLEPAAPPDPLPGEPWKLELLTPALMLRACHLYDQASLEMALHAYWHEASGGALRMATHPADDEPDYCAEQFLRGGFSQTRFAAYGTDIVEPFVLMNAGSWFTLEPTSADKRDAAVALLERWLDTGLPAACWHDPTTLAFETPDRWQHNPFLPQNGYGAVYVAGASSSGDDAA